jgi:hypothetical protein
MKTYLNVHSKSNNPNTYNFLLASSQPLMKKQDPEPEQDTDPYQNVTDPQHCFDDMKRFQLSLPGLKNVKFM